MKKNTIIKISAGIAVVLMLVTGWFFLRDNTNSTIETPNNPDTPSSASAQESGQPTPTPTLSYEEFEKQKDSLDGVEEIAFFSKEDVEKALLTAQEYANASLTNKYFLSGTWTSEGYPMTQLDNALGQYFSNDIREKIKAIDPKTATTKDTLPLVFYVADNGEVSPSPLCAPTKINTDGQVEEKSKEATLTCPVGSLNISEMKYESQQKESGDTVLVVEFTANTKIPVTLNGSIPAATDVTYTYKLEMINNPYYDEVSNPQKFVISAYDNNVLAKKVEATNNE